MAGRNVTTSIVSPYSPSSHSSSLGGVGAVPAGQPRLFDSSGRPVASASAFSAAAGSGPAYEGAGFGRRLMAWGMFSGGPNTALSGSLTALRARSRQLIRNNSHAAGSLDSLVTNLVGNGITPLWNLPESMAEIRDQWQELWSDSQAQLDYSGFSDFYGLQSLIARTMVSSGEALARIVSLPATSRNLVPLQLQLIEPDHLDESFEQTLPNGNRVRMGIEFNARGKRVAYWLWKDHPGELFFNASNERIRVPASKIIHVGRPGRPGQVRFPPWLAPAIVRLHELDQYQDAEVVRKKAAAMFGGFITEGGQEVPAWQHIGPEDSSAETVSATAPAPEGDADKIIALEPGTFPILPPGMDVRFSEPADVGQNYDVFLKYELRGIARVMGITYEQLTGDLSDVNFSSIRAGLLEFRRFCRQVINQVIVYQFCRPVIAAWMDAAVLSGAAPVAPDAYLNDLRLHSRVRWHHDGWEFVDPVKDVTAMKLAVRNGFMSRSEVISQLTGADPAEVDANIAQDNRRAAQSGLKFDSNPADDVQRYEGQAGNGGSNNA